MNQSNENAKKLWRILALLALAIVLVVAMDYVPIPAFTSTENAESESAEITVSVSPTNTGTSVLDPSEIAIGETDAASEDKTLTLTFLGECAPGSPFGTTAYGSLNALTASSGSSYFFSELAPILSEDDLSVIANRCIFTDAPVSQSDVCSAPAENISIFLDSYVDVVAHLSPKISDAAQNTADLCTEAGLTAALSGTVHVIDRHGIRIAILYEQITKHASDAHLANRISEIKKTSDFVILYFHGGEENSHIAEDWLRSTLQTCIRAGVSLAVGTGTNVLRTMETYETGTIVYSLGTLVDGMTLVPENATVLLQADISRSDTGEIFAEIRTIPCYVYSKIWQPTLMTEEDDKALVQQFMAGETALPVKIADE